MRSTKCIVITCNIYLTLLYTYVSLTLTAKSFIELVHYLFKLPDVTSFLSQRICQDPLEKFFGCQRQRGGTHDNPNVQEFLNNTQALRVINTMNKGPIRGNCRGSKQDTAEGVENEPLPKRHAIRKQKHVL